MRTPPWVPERVYTAHKLSEFDCRHEANIGAVARTPFVATDVRQILIRGELDAQIAAEALKPHGLFPILTPSGKAIGLINWNELHKWSGGTLANGKPSEEAYDEVIFAIDACKTQGTVAQGYDKNEWGAAYFNFHTTPGFTFFFHTVYLSNAFSLDASRQTQAFPKHPTVMAMKARFGRTIELSTSTPDGQLLFKVAWHILAYG
jgi:hypothetical protein